MKDYLNIYNRLPREYDYITKFNKSYCNNIFTFDIETTTFFKVGGVYLSEHDIVELTRPKVIKSESDVTAWSKAAENMMQTSETGAVAYLWQFGIDNAYYYGRELSDFKKVLDFLAEKNIYCKIFVHNLSYEFFFLRGVLKFDKVFFTDRRSVLYAEYNGHTFACTYKLTNLSLRAWGKQVGLEKLDTLNYSARVRTPKTRLDRKEIDYGERDIEIMYYGLKAFKDLYGDVWNIPLTQTGTLRRDIKKTFAKDVYYHNLMVNMLPKCADDLTFLKHAFAGGLVISNPYNTNKLLKDVYSYDKTSAYPFIQCVKKFPASEFTLADTDADIHTNDGMHHIYRIRFYNLVAKTNIHILPSSKRVMAQGMETDNGKVIKSDVYECYATEIDVKTIELCYKYERYEVKAHKVATSDYLPKPLVLLILDYYARKTTLKGVAGQEVYYQRGKEKLNAGYGCFATNPVKPDIAIGANPDEPESPDFIPETKTADYITQKLLEKYSKKWNNIVAYSWGIYVTSWQRFLLVSMLMQVKPADACYCDTDCIKGFLKPYKKLFDKENESITNEIKRVSQERDIDFELFQPADIKGNKHLLGVWDNETPVPYAEFKTLGQKRYAVRHYKDYKKKTIEDTITITCSGVPKTAPAPASMDGFAFGLSWDIFNSKKMLVQYKDGNNPQVILNAGSYDAYKVTNPYAVTMRSMSYKISLAGEYKSILETYKNKK